MGIRNSLWHWWDKHRHGLRVARLLQKGGVVSDIESNTEVGSVVDDTWTIPACHAVPALAAVDPRGLYLYLRCDEQGHVVLSDTDVNRIARAVEKAIIA